VTASILVDDVRIAYAAPRGLPRTTTELRDSAPLLVFLHGFGGSARHFEPLARELGAAVTPLVFDMPGCGRSSGEALADVPSMARFVVRVVDSLVPGARFVLLGHSFGGLIAAEVALANAERVSSLVVVASAPRIRLHPEMARQAVAGSWDDAFLRGSFGPRAAEAHVATVLEDLRALRLPHGDKHSDEHREAVIAAWTSHDLTSRLGALRTPTLVLSAGDDVVLSPRHGATWARIAADAEHVEIAGVGHYAQLEDAPSVAAHVRRLLTTIAARRERAHRNDHEAARTRGVERS
jgi:pimeloyl-ACP methyl ester carboxylesterase